MGGGWWTEKNQGGVGGAFQHFPPCAAVFPAACKITATTTAAGMKIQCYFSYRTHKHSQSKHSLFEVRISKMNTYSLAKPLTLYLFGFALSVALLLFVDVAGLQGNMLLALRLNVASLVMCFYVSLLGCNFCLRIFFAPLPTVYAVLSPSALLGPQPGPAHRPLLHSLYVLFINIPACLFSMQFHCASC